MSNTYLDLSGIFYAQKDYLKDLQNWPVTDTNTDVATKITQLQSNLDTNYNNLKSASGSSSSVLDHQTQMNNIVTTEKNRLLKKKQLVDSALEGQKRMVLLNDSYRQKYSYYTKIILVIVFFLVIFIILNLLSKSLPFIPSYVFDILYFLIAA